MNQYLTAQIVGAAAIIVSLVVFQFNRRDKMLYTGAFAAALWTLHFYLLGAPTGAAMNAVGIGRDMTLARTKPTAHNSWVFVLIMSVAGTATALTWQGLISLLPLAACFLNGLSFWNNSTTHIRRLCLLVPPLWFAYNVVVHSYPGMVIECLVLTSNLVAQYRFDHKAETVSRQFKPRYAR